METDILGGVGLGYRTILVLSGGTKTEDLKNFAYQPDMVLHSVADIEEQLKFAERPIAPFTNTEKTAATINSTASVRPFLPVTG